MIIMGVDPGLANTGWGVIVRERGSCRPVAYGCIATKPDRSIAARLAIIHDGLRDVVATYQPRHCAIESVYFGTNAKSAFATGQARGVALLATAEHELAIAEYSPVQIKSVVAGHGSADKDQVAFMVRTQLGLDHTPTPDHAADALAVALTHAAMCAHRALEEASA